MNSEETTWDHSRAVYVGYKGAYGLSFSIPIAVTSIDKYRCLTEEFHFKFTKPSRTHSKLGGESG